MPECGYNVVILRIRQNKGGPPYPHLTMKGHFVTWEEALKYSMVLNNGQPIKAEKVLILPTKKRACEPPYRTMFDKIRDDYEFNMPKSGYALCALDCFEEPGYQIFWLDKYDTYEEALEAKSDANGSGLFLLPDRREVKVE